MLRRRRRWLFAALAAVTLAAGALAGCGGSSTTN